MKKTNKAINYEKHLKDMQFPGNPFDIHRIQDALCALQGNDNFLLNVIRDAAGDDIDGAIKLVLDGYEHNPEMMERTVGEKLLSEIIGYSKSRNRTVNDIPDELFNSPGLSIGNAGEDDETGAMAD